MTDDARLDARTVMLRAPDPCQACKLSAMCKRERMACSQFAQYIQKGYTRRSRAKLPSRDQFLRLYPNDNRRAS